MVLTCNDIVRHIEKWSKKEYAYDWDNVGLIVGESNQIVKRILVALDPIEAVIDEAINNKSDMIITHHPLFISPINNVTTNSNTGKLIYKLIKNNISLYCAHTNLDIAKGGVNDTLAGLFGLENLKYLEKIDYKNLKKIAVFVQKEHLENVRKAMCDAGAGWIGLYSDCTFISEGTGTFKSLEGSNPFIGSINKLERIPEFKIETIVTQENLSKVIDAMLNSHPYEEVAYDIYSLDSKGEGYGLGRVGELSEELSLMDFANLVKEKLKIDTIRLIKSSDKNIKRVAVSSGSGASSLNAAINEKADVFITGDVKYHDAQFAKINGINVIDAGHYATEVIILPVLKNYLENLEGVEVIKSKVNGEPFEFI